MMLWTVQPVDVIRQVKADGQAWVEWRRRSQPYVTPAISWLTWQMRSRLDDSCGGLPWFAYAQRPDLRWVRHSLPARSEQVLIEFDPPPGAFLAFPSWAWHEVFCENYLATTAGEHRAWLQRARRVLGHSLDEHEEALPAVLHAEVEASWLRLFDPTLHSKSWRRRGAILGREAAVDVLRAPWVRRVTPFVATGAWLRRRGG